MQKKPLQKKKNKKKKERNTRRREQNLLRNVFLINAAAPDPDKKVQI